MVIPITETVQNFSTVFTNTATGASVVINTHTTDLEIVGKLCTDYHVWVIVQSTVLLVVIILKGFLSRMLRRNPSSWMKNLYEKADNIIDMLFIVLAIVQLVVAIFALI